MRMLIYPDNMPQDPITIPPMLENKLLIEWQFRELDAEKEKFMTRLVIPPRPTAMQFYKLLQSTANSVAHVNGIVEIKSATPSRDALATACEWGFRAGEKGWNLDKTMIEFAKFF